MTVQVTTLSNGFRIVTEHMPGLASAAIGVWVETGTRHESAAQNGIAHFLEHMAFKGTARRSARQIAEEIETVGGYLNAYTSRERTAYYARVMSGDVPLALDLIADILCEPALADNEIEIERGVILQEIGQVNDTPDDVIFDWLQETAFPDQPMGRAILGPPERVRAFGKGDFRSFIDAQYQPERMILSAAGGVDHDTIVRDAERLFGGLSSRPAPDSEPARYAGGGRRELRPLEQAHFALALPGPGYREPDYYAHQVLSVALGGGMSSRLFQEARERRGLCYTIFAQCSAWSETGMTTIYAGTGEAEIAGLVDLTVDEIRKAGDTLEADEIARARAQCRASLVMGLESPAARAERMAAVLSIWGRVAPLEETLALIDAVDHHRAREAVQRLASETPALVLLGPVEGAPDADAVAARLLAA